MCAELRLPGFMRKKQREQKEMEERLRQQEESKEGKQKMNKGKTAADQYQDQTKGNMKFFTVGLCAKVKGMNLDLSYLIPQESGNPLAHTLRFSLGMKL